MSEPERPVVAVEEQFFNECNTEHGENFHHNLQWLVWNNCLVVPVIVLLTKADAMRGVAIGHLRDEGMTMKEAMVGAASLAEQILREVSTKIRNQSDWCKYPPKDYVPLSGELSSPGPSLSVC